MNEIIKDDELLVAEEEQEVEQVEESENLEEVEDTVEEETESVVDVDPEPEATDHDADSYAESMKYYRRPRPARRRPEVNLSKYKKRK